MADWNARYAAAETGLFGERPSEYLREILARSDFQAGSALFLADGDGRNGTWAAARGLSVTALDLSETATDRARLRDRREGVSVERLVADLATWEAPPGRRWDSIFLFFLHSEPTTLARTLNLAAGALSPGGWLVAEGFSKAQACGAMGPDSPAKLYDLEDLLALVPGLRIVEALQGRVELDEGPRHNGLAEVVRLALRAPPRKP